MTLLPSTSQFICIYIQVRCSKETLMIYRSQKALFVAPTISALFHSTTLQWHPTTSCNEGRTDHQTTTLGITSSNNHISPGWLAALQFIDVEIRGCCEWIERKWKLGNIIRSSRRCFTTPPNTDTDTTHCFIIGMNYSNHRQLFIGGT